MFLAKNIFESILSMDCPLVHGLSPVRPWSVHAQVCPPQPAGKAKIATQKPADDEWEDDSQY